MFITGNADNRSFHDRRCTRRNPWVNSFVYSIVRVQGVKRSWMFWQVSYQDWLNILDCAVHSGVNTVANSFAVSVTWMNLLCYQHSSYSTGILLLKGSANLPRHFLIQSITRFKFPSTLCIIIFDTFDLREGLELCSRCCLRIWYWGSYVCCIMSRLSMEMSSNTKQKVNDFVTNKGCTINVMYSNYWWCPTIAYSTTNIVATMFRMWINWNKINTLDSPICAGHSSSLERTVILEWESMWAMLDSNPRQISSVKFM